jgi:hypothetical protein
MRGWGAKTAKIQIEVQGDRKTFAKGGCLVGLGCV